MALFRTTHFGDPLPVVRGEGVFLRTPRMTDYLQWSDLRERSRDFLVPWEPTWPDDDLTRAAFRRRLRRYADEMRGDLGYPLLLFRSDDEALLGGLTLTNIRRGVAQTGSLGYWIGAPYAGQGLMTRGVAALLPFAFKGLQLHRVEAACIPSNEPSRRLLERCGFRHEGVAREYLCINGLWQDHLLYARLQGD